MKKVILVLLALFSFSGIATAQDTSMVLVPRSSLTREQLNQVQFSSASRWVGLGREVGTAVNSSLQALTTTADDFSKTSVGKFTMFLVAYKVIGTDLIQLMMGILMFITFTPLFIWSYYKSCMAKRILVKETINPDKTKVKEWAYIIDANNSTVDLDVRRVVHLVFYGVFLLGCVAVIFA